jgi:purine-nucleoside/S-methyl-5'-thioadenosine phosphorylase / adenosine deaminase
MIQPDWPAPPRVRALVTTRALGDMARGESRQKLRALLPAEPRWLRQVHGMTVVEVEGIGGIPEADAAISRQAGTVCAVMIADCMPVFFSDVAGSAVAVAHAGWRGLAAGVLEATLEAMAVSPEKQLAWLGPAIGPRVYEVGEDVRSALRGHDTAFSPARPGHWHLDLYAVARQRLAARGLKRIFGGGFCTYTDAARFYSYRRDRGAERMAALIWLA